MGAGHSYRAREIEDKLDLRLNRYARLFEYWESKTTTDLGKSELKERDVSPYDRFQEFRKKHSKRPFSHITIQWSLRLLTAILIFTWIAFILFTRLAIFGQNSLGSHNKKSVCGFNNSSYCYYPESHNV